MMVKKFRTSESYFLACQRLIVRCLLLSQCLPAQIPADTVYQWTDAAGVTQFSGSPPPPEVMEHRTLEFVPGPPTPGEGLREGERTTLRGVEQELARRHGIAEQTRRRNDQAVAEARRECRERRARLRGSGYHASRKADTIYLRRNCW